MHVAKIDDPFSIQTTRYHRSIHKDTCLISQRVAEAPSFVFLCMQAWPFELMILIQIDPFSQLDSTAGNYSLFDLIIKVKLLLDHG